MSRTNKLFMAVARGKESTEAMEIKRYIGVAPVYVLAVNPNKEELEKIYNTKLEKDPVYINEIDVQGIDRKIQQVRIDFIVKTDGEKCKDSKGEPIESITKVAFFVRNMFRTNRDNTKVQVIDKYGQTAWVTKEQYEKKEIPMYKNGPANIDKDYRACFWGEEELTNFIRAYLNIPNVMEYINEKWSMIAEPEKAEVRLDHISDYFKNDFSEVKEIITYQPKNKVKVLFGVRTTEDNKQYQAVYTQMFLRNNTNKYTSLSEDVQSRKNAGAYPNTEFEICPLKVYENKPTDFNTESAPDDLPFGADSNPFLQ